MAARAMKLLINMNRAVQTQAQTQEDLAVSKICLNHIFSTAIRSKELGEGREVVNE